MMNQYIATCITDTFRDEKLDQECCTTEEHTIEALNYREAEKIAEQFGEVVSLSQVPATHYCEYQTSVVTAIANLPSPQTKLELVRLNNLHKMVKGIRMTASRLPKTLVDDIDFFRYAIDIQPTVYALASERVQLDWNIAFRLAVREGFSSLHASLLATLSEDFVYDVLYWADGEFYQGRFGPESVGAKRLAAKSIPSQFVSQKGFMYRMLEDFPDFHIAKNSPLIVEEQFGRDAVTSGITLGYIRSTSLHDDAHVSVHAMKHQPDLFSVFDVTLRGDIDIATAAILLDFDNFEHVSPQLQADLAFVKRTLKYCEEITRSRKGGWKAMTIANNISAALQDNVEVMTKACELAGVNLGRASERLKDQEELAIMACQENIGAFEYVSPRLKQKKDFIIGALKNQAGINSFPWREDSVFTFISDDLKDDWIFVLECLKIDSCIFSGVSKRLRYNYDFIAECLEIDPEIGNQLPKNIVKNIGTENILKYFRSHRLQKKLISELDVRAPEAPKAKMKI